MSSDERNMKLNKSDLYDISKMIQEDLFKIGESNLNPMNMFSSEPSSPKKNVLEKIKISPEKLKF